MLKKFTTWYIFHDHKYISWCANDLVPVIHWKRFKEVWPLRKKKRKTKTKTKKEKEKEKEKEKNEKFFYSLIM